MRPYPSAAPLQEMRSPRLEPELVTRLCNALATKLVGVLRGRHHHYAAKRHAFAAAADLFLAHSKLEQSHADLLADRIIELEADPTFSPQSLALSVVPYFEPGSTAIEMAQDELEAARSSTAMLAEATQVAGTQDLATRRLLMAILDADQLRAKELSSLITTLKGKRTGAVRAPA
jgi:bacterioferritin